MQLAFQGSFSTVWMAAHWEKRLTKNAILCHSIPESVKSIILPGSIYSLRISGHLLLGISKIYSKKLYLTEEQIQEVFEHLLQNTSQATKNPVAKLPQKINLAPREFTSPTQKALTRASQQATPESIDLPERALVSLYELRQTSEEEDTLGTSSNFLEDLETAQQWLDPQDEIYIPPTKRSPESAPKPRKTPKPVTVAFSKKVVKCQDSNITTELLTNSAEVVRSPSFYCYSENLLPEDSDEMFYSPMVEGLCPELENFFISHINILKIKNNLKENSKETKKPSQLNEEPFEEEPQEDSQLAQSKTEEVQEQAETPEQIKEPDQKTEEQTNPSWNPRTLKLLKLLKSMFEKSPKVHFEDLSKEKKRKVMSLGFYEVLQLAGKDFVLIEATQDGLILASTEKLKNLT